MQNLWPCQLLPQIALGWAMLVAPLQKLLNYNKDWEWTDDADATFTALKDAVCTNSSPT